MDKMNDMGEEREEIQEAVPEGHTKKEKYYPTMSVSSEQMPEMKGKKFGDKVSFHIMGEVTGVHEDYHNKEEVSYEIEIKQCGMMGKMSEEEYKDMSDEEKDKADEKEVMKEDE